MTWPAQYEVKGIPYALVHIAMLGHHIAVAIVGVIGFIGDPSPSVVYTIGGGLAESLWSAVFVLFGVLAAGARWRRRVSAELWAVGAIGVGYVLWSAMVAANTILSDGDGLQAAAGLGAGSLILFGWTLSAWAWLHRGLPERSPELDTLEQLRSSLTQVLDERTAEATSRPGDNHRGDT